MCDLALVLNVDVHVPFFITHWKFRLAIQRDGAGNLARCGIDCRCILAAAIEREYSSAVWVVQNPIRILARWYFLQYRLRLQIENDYYIVATITDITPVEIVGDSNAMYAVHSSNLCNRLF